MEKQTPQIVNRECDGNQDEHLARSSGARSVIAPSATQSRLIDDDGGGGNGKALIITIQSPAPNATVPVPLSRGTFTARGVVTATGGAKFDKVQVQFGNSTPQAASGTSNWTCTNGKITASGPLTITARAMTGSSVAAEDTRNVKVVLTDDIPPAVTITQPAEGGSAHGDEWDLSRHASGDSHG